MAAGRAPLSDRLAACADAFAQAKLPMIVRITPFTVPPDLDQILALQGLHRFDDTRVLVRENLRDTLPAHRGGLAIKAIGLEAFAQRVGQFRGSPLAQRQAHAERLKNSPVPFHALELRVDGHAVACGQIAVEGPLAGLYDVFTIESARGNGYAGVLCERLLALAHERGARHAYLQVEGDNHPALAVYARLGFIEGYSYHYRTLDPAAA